MKKTVMILIVAVFVSNWSDPVFSQGEDGQPDSEMDAEIEMELRWIRAEAIVITDLATKTGMDADMVPGIVSVLDGKEMEERGFRTVWEALSNLPGVDTLRYRAIMRGIGYTSNVNTKALLNGAPVNSSMDGGFYALYYIPISQVERIEVIRGSGSAVYGKWAYAGVINVVTRKKGVSIYGTYGSFDCQGGGLLASYENPDKKLDLSLNVAGWRRDDTGIESGPDVLHGTPNQDISQAPGPVDDSREVHSGIIRMEYNRFSLLVQSAGKNNGHDFGMLNALPPMNDDASEIDAFQTARIGWESPEIAKALRFDIYGGWYRNAWKFDSMYFYPPGYREGEYYLYEDGMKANLRYEENSLHAGMDVHWKGWENHALLLGTEYEKTGMGDVWAEANFDMLDYSPLAHMKRFEGEECWIDDRRDRQSGGIFIQDQIRVTEDIMLTAGLRYDWYDDTEDRFTPRISGVFRVSDRHIFKAQYAEAFRPPSFDEMYSTQYNLVGQGNPDLHSETIKTCELAYVFRKADFTAKGVLFFAKLDDLMKWDYATGGYANTGKAETKGAEAEFRWRIAPSLTADGNVSYVDAETKDPDTDITDIAHWLGNLGLVCHPVKNLSFALQYHYTGHRVREEGDPRDRLPEYHVIDITTNIYNFGIKNLTLRAGIKNLFEEDFRYPSRYPGYAEDYPTAGREWWVNLSYDFM